MTTLEDLKPTSKGLVIDLLDEAGIDISSWSDFKGTHASKHPKSYGWSFEKPGEFVLLCLWHVDLQQDGDTISSALNIRLRDGRNGGKGAANWKARSQIFDQYTQKAYRLGLPVRVIICDGKRRDHEDIEPTSSKVKGRVLDPVAWAVTRYDIDTGECILTRGALPTGDTEHDAPEVSGFEGEELRLYVLHRRREAVIRKKKIQAALIENKGVLRCEVKNCGFSFAEIYGELGKDFAHVHHRDPLYNAPKEGRTVTLKELAIVCANCHAMIHRGGECRSLETLIPAR